MRRKRIVDFLVYLVVRVLVCLVQAMRIETGKMLAGWLAWVFCDLLQVRAEVVDDNLAHAFPELSESQRRQLSWRMWEHLFLLVLEVAHAPRKIHETNWRDYMNLRGKDRLVRLLLSDRPTVIVTAHFGNFEVAGYVLAILGFPTYTVARTLDNPYLDRFVNRFRGSTGQQIIPKNGGYDRIVEVLSGGGTLSFLADQYGGPKGCWVEFFGRPASAHKAIALLALDNDATVAVCSARRMGRPLHLDMHAAAIVDPRRGAMGEWGIRTHPLPPGEELDSVRGLTQWYTSRLEEIIRRTPQQYWWLHRRWKDTRSQRRRKKAA